MPTIWHFLTNNGQSLLKKPETFFLAFFYFLDLAPTKPKLSMPQKSNPTYFIILAFTLFSMNAFSQTKINHFAVYAKDLKESSQFYEEVVGLTPIDEPFKDGLHAWYSIGYGLSMHLIEREKPWKEPVIDKTNHLCFSVENLEEFIEKLARYNIPFEDAVDNKGKINIRPDGIRQIYIQDPNGYWIEINDEY
jgi:catechol 2,3-dioxygenase-like lactoylglutathione lyase family enzyme